MHDFYLWQRRRMGILLEDDGGPIEGAWSYDQDNRQALPKDIDIPAPLQHQATQNVKEVRSWLRSALTIIRNSTGIQLANDSSTSTRSITSFLRSLP